MAALKSFLKPWCKTKQKTKKKQKDKKTKKKKEKLNKCTKGSSLEFLHGMQ